MRYQVQTATPNGDSAGIGSEAVLYDSPEAAQQALDELRAAQASCPPGFVDSHVQGVPPDQDDVRSGARREVAASRPASIAWPRT